MGAAEILMAERGALCETLETVGPDVTVDGPPEAVALVAAAHFGL